MTDTSTNTPTTVASAAPELGPNSAMAVATASINTHRCGCKATQEQASE